MLFQNNHHLLKELLNGVSFNNLTLQKEQLLKRKKLSTRIQEFNLLFELTKKNHRINELRLGSVALIIF